MEPRRVRRALPPFEREAFGLGFPSLSPPGSLVRSTEETRVAPNAAAQIRPIHGGNALSACLDRFVP
jgi:hypothetical protein